MPVEYQYDAFVFHQRPDGNGPLLALFLAPAAEVAKWTDVERLSPDRRLAPQREPSPSRISAIKRFFDDNKDNTIPTAIIVGFKTVEVIGSGPVVKLVVRLSDDPKHMQKPGLIIDGQHRLRGFEAVSADLLVPIVAILDASDLEMAFQFLVINNKSARVPRDHLRALTLNYPEDQLEDRLKSARMSVNANLGSVGVLDEAPESPFHGIVAWPNNPAETRIVVPAAIESMAAEARSLGFNELDDPDTLNDFLIAIWSEIKESWQTLFVKESKLLSKVGLACMTHFISTTIKTWARNPKLRDQVDVANPEKVRANTREIVATLDPRFFEVEWRSTSYDTRVGRDLIVNDLETLSYNMTSGEPWNKDLKVVTAA